MNLTKYFVLDVRGCLHGRVMAENNVKAREKYFGTTEVSEYMKAITFCVAEGDLKDFITNTNRLKKLLK